MDAAIFLITIRSWTPLEVGLKHAYTTSTHFDWQVKDAPAISRNRWRGFIGSAAVRYLISTTDHFVLVVDKLTYAGNLNNLASVANSSRYGFLQADICDQDAMSQAIAIYKT